MGSKKFTRMPKSNVPLKIKNFRKLRKVKEMKSNEMEKDHRNEKENVLKIIEEENKEISSLLSNILNLSEHPKQKENIEKLFYDFIKVIKNDIIQKKDKCQPAITILKSCLKLITSSNNLNLIWVLFGWCRKQETLIWGELKTRSKLDFQEIYFYFKILSFAFKIPTQFDNPLINNAIYLFSLIYSHNITITNTQEATIHLKIISCLNRISKLNQLCIPEIHNAFRILLIYLDSNIQKNKNESDSAEISDQNNHNNKNKNKNKIAEKLLKIILNQIIEAKSINCHRYLEEKLNPYLDNCLQIYNKNTDIMERLKQIKEKSKENTIQIVKPKKFGITEIEPIIDEQFIIDD